jgi:hypothetical protein
MAPTKMYFPAKSAYLQIFVFKEFQGFPFGLGELA